MYNEDLKLEKFRIIFKIDNKGNLGNLKIDDFKNWKSSIEETIEKHKIDTVSNRLIMQKFVDLSQKFKFGHINIDRSNKISFSYIDGLREQYVIAFNDSVKARYYNKPDFRLLENGWFEYID